MRPFMSTSYVEKTQRQNVEGVAARLSKTADESASCAAEADKARTIVCAAPAL